MLQSKTTIKQPLLKDHVQVVHTLNKYTTYLHFSIYMSLK